MLKLISLIRFVLRLVNAIVISFIANIRIAPGVKIALSTRIFAEVDSRIEIKKKSVIERHGNIQAFDSSTIIIGSNTFINKNLSCISRAGILIGENTIIGPNVNIYDHNHHHSLQSRKDKYNSAPINIENDVWIGANATILKGVTIGEGAIIPANSVVKINVKSHTTFQN